MTFLNVNGKVNLPDIRDRDNEMFSSVFLSLPLEDTFFVTHFSISFGTSFLSTSPPHDWILNF